MKEAFGKANEVAIGDAHFPQASPWVSISSFISECGSPLPTWETWTELQGSGYGLPGTRLLQTFRKTTMGRKIFLPLCFSLGLTNKRKTNK